MLPRIALAALALALGTQVALACTSKSDCGAGLICCMNVFQDSGHFGSAGKTGTCETRDFCRSQSGTNQLFKPDTKCGKGAVYCTVTRPRGSITGCFPKHLCD